VSRPFIPDSAWTRYIVALSPDECETDPCAPCAYWHTKRRLLAGERLTDWEYDFIGVGVNRSSSTDQGWRDASSALESFVMQRDPRHADVGMQALVAIDVSGNMSEFLAG
jgi:hypothetical protein